MLPLRRSVTVIPMMRLPQRPQWASPLSRWGDEYYGPIGLKMPNDADARDVVEVGTLAYWPAGDSLCIFFGPTPVSVSDEPRAASEVTVLGRIKGSTDSLRSLGSSVAVRIRRA